MALAIIEYLGSENGQRHFKLNIGTNRFFELRLGEGKQVLGAGRDRRVSLEQTLLSSGLQGPLRPEQLGRIEFALPESILQRLQQSEDFSSRYLHVQLISYREQNKLGPAHSDLIRIPLRVTLESADTELRNLAFSKSKGAAQQLNIQWPVVNKHGAVKNVVVNKEAIEKATTARAAKASWGQMQSLTNGDVNYRDLRTSFMNQPLHQNRYIPQHSSLIHERYAHESSAHGYSHTHTRHHHIKNSQAKNSQINTVRVKPFSYRPKQRSQAMALPLIGALASLVPSIGSMITSALPAIGSAVSSALPVITQALPQVLPHLAPLLGGLLGSLGNQSGNVHGQRAGRAAEATLNALGTQENAQHLAALLQQLQQLQNNQSATPAGATATVAGAQGFPGSVQGYSLSARGFSKSAQGYSLSAQAFPRSAQGYSLSAQGYSQAQVAPLAAMLPALMPLLQQVLTPETMQAVLNMPNQHMQTIINGIKDVSQLALQSHEQDLRHLREIHPDLEDPELNQLLMSMSTNLNNGPELNYKRVEAVTLNVAGAQPLTVAGELKRLFVLNKTPWRFDVRVSTPRVIEGGIIHLIVKDAESLESLISKQIPVAKVESGQVLADGILNLQDQAALQIGKDYFVNFHLVWKNSKGQLRGKSIQQRISPVDTLAFDRIDLQGQSIALNDPQQFSDHWHKIWQDRFNQDQLQHQIEARYYLQWDPSEATLARYETQGRFKQEGRINKGQLRTGCEWTIASLDQLRQQLLPGSGPLSPQEKSALLHSDFKSRFGTVAHHRMDMRGSAGKLGEIWVYPIVKLQNVYFKKIAQVHSSGQVQALVEHNLVLPLPVQVQFVGFKS